MEQTSSFKLFYTTEMGSLVNRLAASRAGLKSAAIESLNDLLEIEAPLFPFRLQFDEGLHGAAQTCCHDAWYLYNPGQRSQFSQCGRTEKPRSHHLRF